MSAGIEGLHAGSFFGQGTFSEYFSIFNIAILFLADLFVNGIQGSALRRLLWKPTKSAQQDFFMTGLYVSGMLALLVTAFSANLPALVAQYFTGRHHLDLLSWCPNLYLRCLILLLMFDFLCYWFHRFQHSQSSFWLPHRFHHSATEFTILTAQRTHPFDSALLNLFLCMPFAVLGIPVGFLLILKLVKGMMSAAQHSDFNWKWGWIGKFVLVSPRCHRIHHSISSEHQGRNFADTFIFWDRLFGTYYEADDRSIEIGLAENPYAGRRWGLVFFMEPFYFFRSLSNAFFFKFKTRKPSLENQKI
jgi:sterol desaturase/sphingolipid hydroxylase (fatty acid hydroxylase superfamily)